jgi:hypothetical protein
MVFDDTTPIEEILKVLPEDELNRLSAIGDSRDETRWMIGDIAHEWIDARGLPVLQICKIIGSKVDYGHERVRQLLYTSRFYDERQDLRFKYLNVRYSIFEHARQCDDPEAVLKDAFENNLPVGQVKFTYRQVWETMKEVFTRVPKRHEKEARSIISTALAKLRELAETGA